GRCRRSMTLAMIRRITAIGARITEARRATCARTGRTTNRPKKPIRRSSAAASSAGSMVVEFDARGILRLLPDRDGRIPARYARLAQAAVDVAPQSCPREPRSRRGRGFPRAPADRSSADIRGDAPATPRDEKPDQTRGEAVGARGYGRAELAVGGLGHRQ